LSRDILITTAKQRGQPVGQLRRQWRRLINNFADVLGELGGAKITRGISDGRIIGVSIAFESVMPCSGGVDGLQLSLSAGA
jgi:hypothetical protein